MARLAKRISQETLAAKMQTLGVNIAQDAISNIEAGRRLVMDYELLAFATVLQVPIEELLEPEEE
jgi:transcriptional regulator with XRE-family HTH domain